MKNKSKTYFSPLILEDLPQIEFSNIEDTYLKSDFNFGADTFYILYKKEGDIDSIKNLKDVILIIDLGNFYLIEVEIPDKYNFEYMCFSNGKYSYYRHESKQLIISYLLMNVQERSKNIVEKVVNIFNKNPIYKEYLELTLDVKLEDEVELGSRPDMESETFNSTVYGQFTKIKEGDRVVI